MSPARTLDQERAEAALRAIEEVRGKPLAGDYRTQAQGLPAMLVSSGLGPALAFLAAKGADEGKAHGHLARHVASWVLSEVFGEREPAGGDVVASCFRRITASDSSTYRRAEREALELAAWIKRFAEAYLTKGEGGAP
jgi:CRISPR-associated protein Cmr5